jgi:hypothetical protein
MVNIVDNSTAVTPMPAYSVVVVFLKANNAGTAGE